MAFIQPYCTPTPLERSPNFVVVTLGCSENHTSPLAQSSNHISQLSIASKTLFITRLMTGVHVTRVHVTRDTCEQGLRTHIPEDGAVFGAHGGGAGEGSAASPATREHPLGLFIILDTASQEVASGCSTCAD